MSHNRQPASVIRETLIPLSCGFALTVLFWGSLYLGYGLIGGDVYSYSLPQKVFLSDELARGEIPLWNPLVGQGYPVLGESQTAALYPLNLLCFGLLDVQTAWNLVLLLHYLLAFLAAVWCGRWLGLQRTGSLLAAIVYVYGWFPPRAFLDWAILGGVWLPWSLGCLAAYWQTRRPRYALGLSLGIGLQLLGGHYQLALLTWLLLFAWGSWQVWRSRQTPGMIRRAVIVCLAFGLGVGLAAVQLLPTWELKGRSQRASAGGEHEPAYGHIPPIYLSQLALPWVWYDANIDLDAALAKLTYLAVPAGTNRVEAHLYVGLIPFWLLIGLLAIAWKERRLDPATLFWLLVVGLSLLYATGWLMPLLRFVPGFNFFRGPGRAGVLTTLAWAVLAGMAIDRLKVALSPRLVPIIIPGLVLLTILDLWWTPQAVSYAVSIPHPPIEDREQSPLRHWVREQTEPVRLYAPGANLPTVLGVSAVPVYMGLGPEEYFDPALTLPPAADGDFHTWSPERVAWLRNAGVTHILSFEGLNQRGWPVDLVWAGFDPFLNRAWSRFQEPLWLYRLREAPGRLVFESEDPDAIATLREDHPLRVQVEAKSASGGRLILKDLHYPGWEVTVNGQPAAGAVFGGMFRSVMLPAGKCDVVWRYRPAAVYWGGGLSGLAVLGLIAGFLTLVRRPDLSDTVLPDARSS